jgi:hypothetical protein
MGTWALVGFQRKDGMVAVNIVHCDGYIARDLSQNGAGGHLLEHYNSKKWAKFWAKHSHGINHMESTPKSSTFSVNPWADGEQRLFTFDSFLDHAQNFGYSYSYLWTGGKTGHWVCYERALHEIDDTKEFTRSLVDGPLETFAENDHAAMVVKWKKNHAIVKFIRASNNKSYISSTNFNEHGFNFEIKTGSFGIEEAVINENYFPRFREIREYLAQHDQNIDFCLKHYREDDYFSLKVSLVVARLLVSCYSTKVIIQKT